MNTGGLTITRRIVGPLILLIFAGNVMLVWLAVKALREEQDRARLTQVEDTLQHIGHDFQVSINQLRRDTGWLAEALSTSHPDDALGPQLFLALAQSEPGYLQIRWIGPEGEELIRVDRHLSGGLPRLIHREHLQDKSHRAYVASGLAEADQDVQLSPIELNRENGRLTDPEQPVIRALRQIRSVDGSLRGLLVINADIGTLFEDLIPPDPRLSLRIANQEGEYLLHEDPDQAFAFEYQRSANISQEWPEVRAWLAEAEAFFVHESEPNRAVMYRVDYGPNAGLILLGLDSAKLDKSQREELLLRMALLLLGATVVSSLIAAGIARLIADPLVAMHRVIRIKGKNTSINDLPVNDSGEIGALAQSFGELLAELRQNQTLLTAEALRSETARKQLEDSFSRLQQANQEVEQFAYIASHDLKEPVRTIRSFAELLQQSYRDCLDGEGQEMLDYLQDATGRMDALITGLLDYSRLGKNSDMVPVDMQQLLEAVCADLGARIRETGAQIHMGPMPTLSGMPTELRLLFQNLLANAIKFCPPERQPEVWVQAESIEGGWLFSVRDNGAGIPDSDLSRIFMIFERVQSAVEGTGIGLAHCKKIVEMHGGTIWAESPEKQGSTFYFKLMEPLF